LRALLFLLPGNDVASSPQQDWGGNDLRWELEPVGGGTRLTLWHAIDRGFVAWGAAGWHVCFDRAGADGVDRQAPASGMVFGRCEGRMDSGSPFGVMSMPGRTSRKPATASSKAVSGRAAAKAARPRGTAPKSPSRKAAGPALLAGGNPQVAKAEGDAPVQAYIAAMPGWKSDVGRSLDALVVRVVPGVRKAVKWNSPFYGVDGQGWFLNFHTFTNYVKVAFFRGASLRPVPPGESKHQDVRYLDIREDDRIDDDLLASWIRQAAALPGWAP
jgi:hypothetical protein